MAIIQTTEQERQGRGYLDSCVTARLKPARPMTEGGKLTIFRPIPEIGADGSIRPMVQGITPNGIDFSALVCESVTINAGTTTSKYTGISRDSSQDASTRDWDMIYPGAYIRAQSAFTKSAVPESIYRPVSEALLKSNTGSSKLPKPSKMLLMQGILLELNGTKIVEPVGGDCLFLSPSARDSVVALLRDAHARGIDVFSPTDGYYIVIRGKPSEDPKQPWRFVAELGEKLPLDVDVCRRLWVPWDAALVVYDRSTMMEKFFNSYGYDLAKFIYPDERVDPSRITAMPETPNPVAHAPATSAVVNTGLLSEPLKINLPVQVDASKTASPNVGPAVNPANIGESNSALPSSNSPPNFETLRSSYASIMNNLGKSGS